MKPTLSVLTDQGSQGAEWIAELKAAVRGVVDVEVKAFDAKSPGEVIFVDEACTRLEDYLDSIDRKGRAIFLVTQSTHEIPRALLEGDVDDVLVHPFRPLEVLSKVQHYRQLLMWDEVTRLNESFADLIHRLKDDVKLAESLQRAKLPVRFPDLKDFQAATRYLAGMRSGGDHFDIAESKSGMDLSIVLSDSSSYGLSSAVLSVLMTVVVKLTSDEARSPRETVGRVYETLQATLSEKDHLSLFYGTLSRKDFRLRYLNLGSSIGFHAPADQEFQPLKTQAPAIRRGTELTQVREAELELGIRDRLVLVSDGFVDAVGGTEPLIDLLNSLRAEEPKAVLNELAYRVKSEFVDQDDMPEQDCSALCLDVAGRVIRLAKKS